MLFSDFRFEGPKYTEINEIIKHRLILKTLRISRKEKKVEKKIQADSITTDMIRDKAD